MNIRNRLVALGRPLSLPMMQGTMDLYAELHAKNEASPAQIHRDRAYGPNERHRLDVFTPQGKASSKRPVLIFVHGGGFVSGDKTRPGTPYYDNIGHWAAAHGCIGVTMTYRLAPQHAWPSGAEDVGRAVEWVAQEIEEYGGDPHSIFLMGQSAGAVHVANYLTEPRFHRTAGRALAGALLISGVYDVAIADRNQFQKAYYGADDSRWGEFSSLPGLAATDLPLLVSVSELDPDDFQRQAAAFVAASLARKNEYPRLLYLQGHNHLSSVLQIGTAEDTLGPQIETFIRAIGEQREDVPPKVTFPNIPLYTRSTCMRISAAVSRPQTPAPVIESLELQAPRPGEMRVRIVAAGICHTDLHAHSGRLSPLPIVLGHEGVGIVEEIGEGVREFAPGDAVLMSGSSCGVCPNCCDNHPSYCDQAMPRNFGGKRMDGSTALSTPDGTSIHSHFFGQSSFASHSVIPERTAVKLEAGLPLEKLAPLGCGVITGAGSIIESLRVGAGSSVAIFGVGGVGLSAVMAARLVGAERIVAIDTNPARLELARELGATDTFAADTEGLADRVRAITGRGVNYTFNTTTSPPVFTTAIECLAMRGVAGFVTAPRGDWAPPMFKILAGGRVVRGILGGDAAPRQFVPMLIRYWQQGRFPFDRLIRFYPFADIGKAFADIAAGQVIKPVLRMP